MYPFWWNEVSCLNNYSPSAAFWGPLEMPWHSCSHPGHRDAGTEIHKQGKRLNDRTKSAQQPCRTPCTGLHVNTTYIINAGQDQQTLKGPFSVTGSYMHKREKQSLKQAVGINLGTFPLSPKNFSVDTAFLRLGHGFHPCHHSPPSQPQHQTFISVRPTQALWDLQHLKLSAYKYKVFKNSSLTTTGFAHISWQICGVWSNILSGKLLYITEIMQQTTTLIFPPDVSKQKTAKRTGQKRTSFYFGGTKGFAKIFYQRDTTLCSSLGFSTRLCFKHASLHLFCAASTLLCSSALTPPVTCPC